MLGCGRGQQLGRESSGASGSLGPSTPLATPPRPLLRPCPAPPPPALCPAEEMLERALYALEMAWHPSFSPAAASMHVPYEEPNAPLFTCLFRWG